MRRERPAYRRAVSVCLKQRADMLDALSASHLEAWRPRLQSLTQAAHERLLADRPVDLFSDFNLPCGLALAILAAGADPAVSPRLSDLGNRVFAATGADESDSALRS